MFFIFSPSVFRHRTICRRVYGQWLLEIALHQLPELRERDGMRNAPRQARAHLHWHPSHIAHNDWHARAVFGDRKLAIREASHRVAVRNLALGSEEKSDFFVGKHLRRAGVAHGDWKLPLGVKAAGQRDRQLLAIRDALERLLYRDSRHREQAAINPLAS